MEKGIVNYAHFWIFLLSLVNFGLQMEKNDYIFDLRSARIAIMLGFAPHSSLNTRIWDKEQRDGRGSKL